MEINIECPWCNQHYSVDESFIGQNVECAVCEKQFIVRNPDDSAPASENEPASPSSPEEKPNPPDVPQDCTPDDKPSMTAETPADTPSEIPADTPAETPADTPADTPDQEMLKELEARRAEMLRRFLDGGSLRGLGGIIFWLLLVCLFFATLYYLAGD